MAFILEFETESDIINASSKNDLEDVRFADLKDLPFDDEEVFLAIRYN
jgi:hypothetical protein